MCYTWEGVVVMLRRGERFLSLRKQRSVAQSALRRAELHGFAWRRVCEPRLIFISKAHQRLPILNLRCSANSGTAEKIQTVRPLNTSDFWHC